MLVRPRPKPRRFTLSARSRHLGVLLAAGLAACGGDSTGPASPEVRLAVAHGNAQFVQPGLVIEYPLAVRVTDAGSGAPVADVEIGWRVLTANGATLLSAAPSDEAGIASVRVRAGPDSGLVRIEATAPRGVGGPAMFEVHVVRPPAVTSVTPASAAAGTDVTINGSGFAAVPADNTVLIGGLRALVRSATPTGLVVQVPSCVLDRSTDLRVMLGAVPGNALPFRTMSGPAQPVQLERGQRLRLLVSVESACLDFSAAPAGAEYLVVMSDVSSRLDLPLRYELLGFTGGAPVPLPARMAPAGTRDPASEFELRLRDRERTLKPPLAGEAVAAGDAVAAVPAIGDSREFNVLKPDQKSTFKTRATVRVISDRAIIYVSDDAPASGLTTGDLTGFAELFDDPIHSASIAAFGSVSDIDANGRIIILFSPAVNSLTARGQPGFIAGYFYGCDLVTAERCKPTNRGEIFYAMVPDPTGQFSDPRARLTVLQTVPAVLAHEFQHMISFSRRGGSLDAIWLSEGMAHAAEDIVGDVFAQRGEAQNAANFQRANYQRAQLYLRQAAAASRIGLDTPGSLEMRGGAWLFVKYLAGHFGGGALLERITGATSTGAPNVTAATGIPWNELSADFSVALFADGNPAFAGATLDPRLGFRDFDLRAALSALSGGFPVLAQTINFQDLLLAAETASAAQAYLVLRAPAAGNAPFRVAFTGPRGGPFPTGQPALSLLRIR